ncbi:MAG TPA: hypothetical protein VNB24_09750 [Acidimicrobiales bacterium]|nr:hypothetical protein [Acidimicrobiales bacterium]
MALLTTRIFVVAAILAACAACDRKGAKEAPDIGNGLPGIELVVSPRCARAGETVNLSFRGDSLSGRWASSHVFLDRADGDGWRREWEYATSGRSEVSKASPAQPENAPRRAVGSRVQWVTRAAMPADAEPGSYRFVHGVLAENQAANEAVTFKIAEKC